MPRASLIRVNAAGAADERGLLVAPATALLRVLGPVGVDSGSHGPNLFQRIELVSLSTPTDSPDASPDRTIERPGCLLMPALVNAHAHLDLTHLGPRTHSPGDGFVAWVDMIRAARAQDDHAIADSVRLGIDLAIRGGTAAVGDIAGAPAGQPNLMPLKILRESPLSGVSYLEFFGIGARAAPTRQLLGELLERQATDLVRAHAVAFGLQPHAPNTVARELYLWVAETAERLGLPISTHLAETPEEIEFVASASGPQRELLERLGAWDDSIDVGGGLHPIEHLATFLRRARALRPPPLLAHVNALGDHLDELRDSRASVAYCPRASAYFDAPGRVGPHRYREMLAAGVNVCLGTDSIVCLPPEHCQGGEARLSVLDDMRLLRARDGTDPATLIAMGTTRGARALGLDPARFRLDPGPIAGLIAAPTEGADPLAGALAAPACPETLCLENHASSRAD